MKHDEKVMGEQIAGVVADKKIKFNDGAVQHFFADGTTNYIVSGASSPGTWHVDGDDYCSVWPPSSHVDCYQLRWVVAENAQGLLFEHTITGEQFTGLFID